MPKKISNHKKTYLSSLSEQEQHEIEEKVKFELEYTNYDTLTKMTKIGGTANVLGAMFVILVLYNQISPSTMITWFIILLILNLINIVWSGYFGYRYPNATAAIMKKWHYGLYIILASLTLTWGSIGVLFIPHNPYYQLYVITFLQVVVLSYGFGATIDFRLALISIGCLLLPTIFYRTFLALQHIDTLDANFILNIAFAISLFILGGFLLIVCYIGYVLTINQITLSSLNAVLNEKLENVNKFLEQRVKERTAELEESLKLVTYQATHDLLTDLPNQRLLLEMMNNSIKTADKQNNLFAVIFLTLNEIEKINDGLGHHVGDLVIKTIAQRFKHTFAHTDHQFNHSHYTVFLSRKDVFIILIEPIFKVSEVEEKSKAIFSILDEPIYSENQIIRLTASIGISLYPRNGADTQSLLMNADAAMVRAQSYGGNSINMYKSEINADISKQLELESNLHNALKNSEFMVYYQPFVDIKTGEISGAEALVRWENPLLGMISPANFIPIAEENGLIIPLGEWVFRTACKHTMLWHKLGFVNFKVAINLSAKQLYQKNILSMIEEVFREINLDPKFIELELTETTAFQENILPIIQQFKNLGLGLSIDDFGTGYSGLSNLKQIAIDKLKIDKSFVEDIESSSESKTIVANIISLAKKMDIEVLAEGVERREQLLVLRDLGCDLIQGYYFSQPVNADVLTELLITKKRFEI